jgi:hypothetical protein
MAYVAGGQLVVAAADGSDPRPVALPAAVVPAAPQWSPGGRRLVFGGSTTVPGGGGAGDAYVTRADGSGTRRLTTRGTVASITWSSRGELAFDDERIVYLHDRPLINRIMRLDLRTGAVHLLTRAGLLRPRRRPGLVAGRQAAGVREQHARRPRRARALRPRALRPRREQRSAAPRPPRAEAQLRPA